MSHFNSPRIVKQEAEHAQRNSPERAAPTRPNGVAESRPIDILELLSKAKEEYQRVRRQTHVTCYLCSWISQRVLFFSVLWFGYDPE